MREVELKTLGAGQLRLNTEQLQAFQSGFSGPILTAESPEYDKARALWNGMIDKRPALIAQCRSLEDVMRAVRLAADRSLAMSVRAGGHGVAGSAICEGGMVIDLSQMRAVSIDERQRIARVEAGATLGDFDKAAQAYGLAGSIGINSTTGVAGLTLGGGFGWLSRTYGHAVDNLLSCDVVLASGQMVTASATENPDLFWALRGGGGNFGVATSFTYRLHKVGPDVFSGLIVHPIAAARDVFRYYREFAAQLPDQFACWVVLRKAPPLPVLPTEWHGKEVLVVACFCSGSIEEGERIAQPMRAFGKPIADLLGPHPYLAWQSVLDPLLTPGARNYWKSHNFKEVRDELIDALIGYAKKLPDDNTEIAFAQLGGASNRVAPDATAYPHRDVEFVINVHGRWTDPAKDTACIGWVRDLYRSTAPFSSGGVYVNFLAQDDQDKIRAAYGPNYDRLAELKRRYDPQNMFRANLNILPAS